MTTWDIILDSRLVDVYQLDELTLKTNRTGRMTDGQREYLGLYRWRKIRRMSIVAVIALFLVIGSSLLPVNGFLIVFKRAFKIVFLLTLLIQLVRMVRFYQHTEIDMRAGKVRMYPGRLNKVVWYGIRILFCERGAFYSLPDREWNAFEHYCRYRIFCTPRTNIIVGAHPVHRDEPLPEAWGHTQDKR